MISAPGASTSSRVHDALASGRPVVALETAVLTHGLPRQAELGPGAEDLDVRLAEHPGVFSARVVHAMSRMVEAAGAVPAVVGVMRGVLRIGLDSDEITRLAEDDRAEKVSASNLPAIIARGSSGGTTVAATLAACVRARPATIRVLATGGIGGVHRHWQNRPDVSADLGAIARCGVAVVCSGAKSILDAEATIEALEAMAVPVLGVGTRVLPRFHSRGDDRVRVCEQVDSPADGAAICRARWHALGAEGGLVLANPVPERHAMDHAALQEDIVRAESAADEPGAGRTPALLRAMAESSGGAALRANVALLLANAEWAARLAGALAATADSERR